MGASVTPNLSATASHKLAPRSTLCIFLGYTTHHKGCCCLDLISNTAIILHHVTFDEMVFPFTEHHPSSNQVYFDFLDDFTNHLPAPIGSTHFLHPAGPPNGAPLASA